MSEIYDEFGGMVRRVHVHDTHDKHSGFTTRAEQECEGLIQAAADERDNLNLKAEFRPIAKIPMVVIEQAMREGWFNDKAKWKQWINDRDNYRFRIWEGRI
jgi:thioesterase domain-containing protein